ncbi:hypothetical protein CH255_13255 [Rhodococcus sp. 05-2255-2A2]|uniref:hypothetical protein n=1 Tax=unclassified Rhodococcus (in: high G+C Gram-positive bacteria) TaxID=192944 RepID=UPI000B9B303B|nr:MULTISPECIES: hypothetical protein [unclassified Rhodococcus (in: high G+C Gram-positive bacteria)]OZE13478.1 hypothetical protein CH250_06130 [Rhodococcus sp. 05-2255-3C]OZE18945.1 hypothetical protein CH255_13255 [Rhodococcus sp. 05-2255-2A2]
MMVLAILLVAVGLVMLGGGILLVDAYESVETQEQRLRRDVLRADQQVQREYREARRAMNIASGQAWRNLAD